MIVEESRGTVDRNVTALVVMVRVHVDAGVARAEIEVRNYSLGRRTCPHHRSLSLHKADVLVAVLPQAPNLPVVANCEKHPEHVDQHQKHRQADEAHSFRPLVL
jgi:hypothetical protein